MILGFSIGICRVFKDFMIEGEEGKINPIILVERSTKVKLYIVGHKS